MLIYGYPLLLLSMRAALNTRKGFKATIDQMAETGFEMLVFSFGSGFILESADPLCLFGVIRLCTSSEGILKTIHLTGILPIFQYSAV